MKFTIKKIGKYEGTSKKTGKDYTILTFLTEDNQKIKAFGNQVTNDYKEGQAIEAETEMKKDKDGFDEMWLKSERKGGGWTRNLLPDAYALAIDYLRLLKMSPDENVLDQWAKHFHVKISGNVNSEQPKIEAPKKKPADEAGDEDNVDLGEIPF